MYFPEYFLYKFSSLELTFEGLIARQLVQLAYTKKTIRGLFLGSNQYWVRLVYVFFFFWFYV